MSQLNEPHFRSNFITDYIENNPAFGKKRILTYTIFRFLAAEGPTDKVLASLLSDKLSQDPITAYLPSPENFSAIETYLAEDDYFSPSLNPDSFEPLFLYDAIFITENYSSGVKDIIEDLMADMYPALFSIDFTAPDLDFSSIIKTEPEFYAALYLLLTRFSASLADLLPGFAAACSEPLYFMREDFILYDFMDEYFETKNCRLHPSFQELTDVLVTAVLNYYRTDFEQLASEELPQLLDGSSSKFAGIKRFGSVTLVGPSDKKSTCAMLHKLFCYAAVYELRNNLFDFHLEDDKLITLDNWKTNLRWHYVQYSNVYELAMSSFYAAVLSNKLLKSSFKANLVEISTLK